MINCQLPPTVSAITTFPLHSLLILSTVLWVLIVTVEGEQEERVGGYSSTMYKTWPTILHMSLTWTFQMDLRTLTYPIAMECHQGGTICYPWNNKCTKKTTLCPTYNPALSGKHLHIQCVHVQRMCAYTLHVHVHVQYTCMCKYMYMYICMCMCVCVKGST